jgi:hypothetical protein
MYKFDPKRKEFCTLRDSLEESSEIQFTHTTKDNEWRVWITTCNDKCSRVDLKKSDLVKLNKWIGQELGRLEK